MLVIFIDYLVRIFCFCCKSFLNTNFITICTYYIFSVEGNEVGKILVGRQLNDDHSHEKDEVSFEGLDRMMGISLVLGFIFMMFVEQLADYMSGNSNNRVIATDAESLVQSSGK